ncbi:3TM-type holin [Hahella ganghwensis]|uniref:3TM-type holin n=1 Tax=Hahella ganghwensis TaxID=286420 RepID=UPI00037EB8E7|nr:3TM-type holin [Hahella ganghwensis]
MNVFGFIKSIFEPAVDLVDELHTSDEEKAQIKNALFGAQSNLLGKVLEYEMRLAKIKASIIQAEAQGQSWLQRNWRPITMLTFLALVVCDSFGLLTFRLADQAWTLLQIGLGGYVVGRSAEKIIPKVMNK